MAALVGAALFPQVAYVEEGKPNKKTGAPCSAMNINLLVRDPDEVSSSEPSKASVHPSSVAAQVGGGGWASPFVAFHERVLTTKVYMRDVTPLPPLALPLLCGSRVVVEGGQGEGGAQAGGGGRKGGNRWGGSGNGIPGRFCTLVVDGWLRLQVPSNAAPTILAARRQVDGLLRGLVTGAQAAGGGGQGGGKGGGKGGNRGGGHGGRDGASADEGAAGKDTAVAAAGLVAALGELVEMKASAEVVAQPKGGGGGKKGPNNNAKKRAKKRPAVAARALRRGQPKKAKTGGGGGWGGAFGGGGASEYSFYEGGGGGMGDW